jgi:GH24 family phage-related lysozyme (muramidase)
MAINLDRLIRATQALVGLKPDGDAKTETFLTIYKAISGKDYREESVFDVPAGFPSAAVDLILEEEGIDQPYKWPGGGSGITLGYGCDIGADPSSLEFWRGILTNDEINSLQIAKGKTGREAAAIANRFRGIKVTREDALKVFLKQSLPREIEKTKKTFPGIELLPPEVLGVMTSIVYNRGTDLDRDRSQGDRRKEMREIADIIAEYASTPAHMRDAKQIVNMIAQKVVSMKRLWEGKGVDGLLARRDNEAAMLRNAVTA